MKILMATMGLDIGGAETHIVELVKELHHEGHDVAVVSNGGVYVPEIKAAGIRHYNAPLHRRSVREMMQARELLKKIIRQEQPDVVHAHARIPAFLCGTLQHSMGFPFVTTAHWVFDSRGLLRYLTNWGQRTIAVSEDIRDYLIREYSLPASHITVTINGIDDSKFSPEISGARVTEEFALDPGAPVVSYVSRMDADRALVAEQLIDAAPQLSEAVPGIQFLIAGGGNVFERLKARSEDVNAALGRRCIVMTGPRTDINEIVAAGDVFVGVSRAALEAMAAGKPAVIAGNEGFQGLFGPDKLEAAMEGNFCCRGMPASTGESLVESLTEVFRLSPAERQKLGQYGRETVQEHYSVRRMASDCLSVYDQVRHRKYQVLMSGYYGFSNAGDDAILQSIQQGVREASSEITLTALSDDPALTESQFGLNAVPRFQVFKVFSAMRHSDALLSGGGSLLQDTTSTRSLLYYLAIIRMAQMLGRPVMLYANGIGPVQHPRNRKMVRKAVERATVVTLRDHSSADELVSMGVSRTDLHVTADPVFHMEHSTPEQAMALLQSAGLPEGAPFAAVSVRSWPGTGNFHQELARLCDHLRQKHGLEILFIMMQPPRDRTSTTQVQSLMQERSFLLDAPCTPAELMGALGQAKICIAMRLHTLIFAARMAVPTLGIVYDPKVESYLQELELPSAGRVDAFDSAYAIRQADALLSRYDEVLHHLQEKSAALAQASRINEQLLLDMLESRQPSLQEAHS